MADKETDLKPIIENIKKDTEKDEAFITKVLNRLQSFGYIPAESDAWIITFCIDKVDNQIMNSCNILKIPNKLIEVEIDRICGEFLFSKKQSGQLTAKNGFNIEMAVKQIQAGDTNVQFADDQDSIETKLNTLISHLINSGENELVCFRQLKW